MIVVVAHAGADDIASVLFVAGVVAAGVALRHALRRVPWVVPALVAVVLLTSAVAVTRWARPTVRQARTRPRSTAHLQIVDPRDGAVVTGPTVRVVLRLDGGHLVAATSTKLAPDQGHVHVLLDGRIVSSVAALTTALHDVPPGRHVLVAEYVALDHGPFSPPVRSGVTVTVVSS
jgi:hypothetical protein